MKKKLVNHWGIWVDPDKPVTGVISLNQVNAFVADRITLSTAIDLAYIEAKNEFIREFQIKIAKETGIFRMPNDQEMEEFNDEVMDLQGDWLIGSWKLDKFGKYEHDEENGDFAAIVREDVVQVVWSKYVTKCKNLCSPCYPGQADVNSGLDEDGEFLAYNLPPSAYGDINYSACPECNIELAPIKIEGSIYYYKCKTCGYERKVNEDRPEFPFGEFDNGKHWQGEF